MTKRHVQLSASPTPNPNAVKFLPNMHFFESGTIEFQKNNDNLDKSPLAKKLLDINGIDIVMIGFNFISVTKSQEAEWEVLLEKIRDTIVSHLENDEKVIDLDYLEKVKAEKKESSSEIESKIKEILDDEIRPAIAMDGGDVEFKSFVDGIVTLHLQGACSTCPSSTMTLKMGIENRLKSEIPEVVEVVQEI